MSNQDSDSDTPADMCGIGLPNINQDNDSDSQDNGEETKANQKTQKGETTPGGSKNEKFNKFRDQAKDLVSKTEKPKQLYLANTKVTKISDEASTNDSGSAKPKYLEINDPRFNYDVILSKGYKLLKKMGNGAYASVFLCERSSSPDSKCILKISIGEERMPDTQNEYAIMNSLDYENIPKVKELIMDNDYFYSIICMEYSNIDENVQQYVNRNGSLNEDDVKLAMKELFSSIEYIHSMDYAHRDVKPDNVLIKISEAEKEGDNRKVQIVLVDYNIAKKAKSFRAQSVEECKDGSEPSKFRCNYLTHIASQNSQAPELFKSGYYSESVDIWGAGLVFYTLLTGEKVKRGPEQVILDQVEKIDKLSEQGKELLRSLFSFDGEKRPTAEEALEHPWLHQ
jgi:serine/threonine protein kinase